MFSEDLFDVFEKNATVDVEVDVSEDVHLTEDESTTHKHERTEEIREKTQEEPLKKRVKLAQVVDSFEESQEKEFIGAKVDYEGKKLDQHTVKLATQTRHQVAIPKDYAYTPLNEHQFLNPPNRSYPFELDPFQKAAVACIERNESVLVSAHTSAGKTVVAEYAIATALKNKQRVIYTSPIKALSNQKYRELLQEFGDVGLQTGDVTINPSASCLVMTTEILRSMMYRGSEHMREVSWVIFDEIHYMRDLERGVVWEESIILLPHKVRYAFLSATIPNSMEFAEWICELHNQPCHVVYTDYRPVPLQHYLFAYGGDGINLVVDEKSQFNDTNFMRVMSKLENKSKQDKPTGGKKKTADGGNSDLFKIVRMIWQRNYQPVICFSFAKRECENNALQISKLDFSSQEEKELIKSVFRNAITQISEEDRKLPQIAHILPLLERGIGIHHSGLLPILKEIIEILFQEGLIKVLFATETFSIGLNMPAKTVVFTDLSKYDGKENRLLTSGEYIQMSGRAGRRGLDDRGIVIVMLQKVEDEKQLKEMLKGNSDRLNSAFHQKYSMILNLMRVEGLNPEFLLSKSFYQFQMTRQVPEMEKQLEELEKHQMEIKVENEHMFEEYFSIREQLEGYRKQIRTIITSPTVILPFIQTGRLIEVEGFGTSVVLSYKYKQIKSKDKEKEDEKRLIIDALVPCRVGGQVLVDGGQKPEPGNDEMVAIPLTCEDLLNASTLRIHLPKDLRSRDSLMSVKKSLQEVRKRFKDAIPQLDPIEDLKLNQADFIDIIRKVEILESRLGSSDLDLTDPVTKEGYERYLEKQKIIKEIKQVKKKIRETNQILQLEELKIRKRILRRLAFTKDDVVELKGRVACEISAGDELVLTELLFSGAFTEMTPGQVVAVLSCCIDGERNSNTPALPKELEEPYNVLKQTVTQIHRVSVESKLELNLDDYLERFRPDMMQVAYDWANGVKFVDLCKSTEIFEGSIIRSLRRLEELMRQLVGCSMLMGNEQLKEKLEADNQVQIVPLLHSSKSAGQQNTLPPPNSRICKLNAQFSNLPTKLARIS